MRERKHQRGWRTWSERTGEMLWREPRRITSLGEISETGFGGRLWRGQEERLVERMI